MCYNTSFLKITEPWSGKPVKTQKYKCHDIVSRIIGVTGNHVTLQLLPL